jgi:hypothetical protein
MKRFTVDMHWDFARSYEVDTDSKEDAEHKVESHIAALKSSPSVGFFFRTHPRHFCGVARVSRAFAL